MAVTLSSNIFCIIIAGMGKKYQTKEICQITGCSHRQLQYWESKGYLKPEWGSRNIRYYSKQDIELVKTIIQYKKAGKSLGEAVSQSKDTVAGETTRTSIETLSELTHLENMWLQKNKEIIALMETIKNYEKQIPRYPYSVYSQEHMEEVKLLQDKLIYLTKQRNHFYEEILKIYNNTQKSIIKQVKIKPTNSLNPDTPKQHFSLDQLVLIWLRKNKAGDTLEVRKLIEQKLKAGETLDSIYRSIQSNQ